MPVLLALNPNTSEAVSALLARVAAPQLPAGWTLRTATARFGARYIAGEAAAAVAGHAALDAWAADRALHGEPDAVLLACFGDPGLFALQALSTVPVLGLAEASMRAAAREHGRFAIVTGGAAWGPMLERLARSLGLDGALAGVITVERSGGELAADPELAVRVLGDAARSALARWPDARAVLLGGAGLAGLAAPLAGAVPVPVLDNVLLALRELPAAAQSRATAAARASERGPWRGLSAELLAAVHAAIDPTPAPPVQTAAPTAPPPAPPGG